MTETQGRLLGRQLGNYTLTRVLGAGGFAEVYLGTHRHLETQAAIKVLQTQLNQADQEQFLAEARTVARLKHPHIVRILEFGIEHDVPYLVMNYAAHGTLRKHFQRGVPLAPSTFLPYLKQIASALQYAHNQGLIHRDIKPENMLLDEQDEVFLSDFGIATQARSSRSQSVEEIIGTVAYMAPEQLQGKPRPASDQYSLAIVAYEWLTGTRPFQGDSYLAIASQHLTKPPRPLREHVPGLAPAVEQVVLTALAKDYHQRYARVQDFAEALEQAYLNGRYLSPQDFASRPAEPRSSSAPALATPPQSAPLYIPPPPDSTLVPGNAPTQVAPSTQDMLTSRPAPITEAPVSPEGTLFSRRALIGSGLAATVLAGGSLAWWAITQSTADKSPGTNNQNRPTGGTTIAGRFLTQGRLVHTYKHTTKVDSVTWSKDSKYVASVEGDTIVHVWNATTGEDLWSISTLALSQISQVAWSPDGNSLAVLELLPNPNGSPTVRGVEIFDTTSHQQRSYYALPGQHIAWSPDSKLLAVAGFISNVEGSLICIWDGNTNHDPLYTLSVFDTAAALAWKRDGKELAISFAPRANNWVSIWPLGSAVSADALFNNQFTLNSAIGEEATLSWSPAGENWIASASSSLVEIWDADTLGKSYDQKYNQFARPAVWSPDGHYLASTATADQTIRVWNARDQAIASTCAGQGDTITSIVWSPDGKYLATTAQGTGQDRTVRIWQVGN